MQLPAAHEKKAMPLEMRHQVAIDSKAGKWDAKGHGREMTDHVKREWRRATECAQQGSLQGKREEGQANEWRTGLVA
jgi:hypothetical protein